MQYKTVSADPRWIGSAEQKESVFLPFITRQGDAEAFDQIDLVIDLKDVIDPATPVLCGASEMGGRITRHILNDAIPLSTALWILFRTKDGKKLLFGVASWQVFTCDLIATRESLTVRYYGDRKPFAEGQTLPLETIFFAVGDSEHEVLTKYADHVAETQVGKLNLRNWRGWGSWDYYTSEFTEDILRENIEELLKVTPEVNLLQIDDGYCINGDWQDFDPEKLPNGLAPLVADMKAKGISTGIWMAPFMARKYSKVAQEHPDWFLKNVDGSMYFFNGGDTQLLDFSQDEVVEYMRQCVRTMIQAGVVYLKLDFLLCGTYPLLAKNPMTPYERLHRCLSAIREEAGENTYLLGCSAAFGPCVGHVDGMRTGPDIGPSATSVSMTAGCCMASYPFHRTWFQCDTDYFVLRGEGMVDEELAGCKKGALSDTAAKAWADFLMLTGSTLLASDKLSLLTEERRELLRSVWQNAGENSAYTVLDPASGGTEGFSSMVYSHGRLGLFNLSETEKTFRIPGREPVTLPPVATLIIPDYVWDGKNIADPDSVLLPLEGTLEPFADGADAMPVSIEPAANALLCSKRGAAEGIMEGIFGPLLGNVTLQNVPFSVTDHVICLPFSKEAQKVQVPVNKKLSKLFILHSASYPTSGPWTTYTVNFADGTSRDFPVNASENRIVADYHYGQPWTSATTRLAWTDPIRGRGVYVMMLDLENTRDVTGLTISSPEKPGMHMVLAVSGINMEKY